ncbi:hypothetical protein SHOU24_82 [Vibrio phage SHOU24]|uniref:hypothetical protein n=1 Tax=Vibrio phage SHOU24 TaxID=1414739 RepID=UPI0003ED256C|nr:hypothetical protein SHOU24_82 [Vibrio phage SHOU24]AHI61279.1 hypothetical protein SHOU24_82 [Vibrio phage SHOU24]
MSNNSKAQIAASKAQAICEANGTTLARNEDGSFLIVSVNSTVGKCKVRKVCMTSNTHKVMDVTLGSIIHSGRGGCATCARIKGGKTSRK